MGDRLPDESILTEKQLSLIGGLTGEYLISLNKISSENATVTAESDTNRP